MIEHPAMKRPNFLVRAWRLFSSPSVHFSLGAILVYGFAAGILFWGSFHWAMELSNTETFCVACHEHSEFVLQDLKATKHYSNESGIRATCHNCHVPEEWAHKVLRKIYVTNEAYHHLIGSISTPEKFEAKRQELAGYVWDSMRKSDSRECRNCHSVEAMNLKAQEGLAARQHQLAAEQNVTCIECHMGVVHKLPAGAPPRRLLTESR